MYITLSNALRTEIKLAYGRTTLYAVQEHLYHKALGYFDARADWQITQILEMSEMADRLKKLAASFPAETAHKLEALRIAKIIEDDFHAVHEVAMQRAVTGWKTA